MEGKNLEEKAKQISQVFTKLQQLNSIENLNKEDLK